MPDSEERDEEIEKVRQEIMRLRELLNIMRQNLDAGERSYAGLFSNCTPEEKTTMKEKDLQWKVAEQIVGDVSQLRNAVANLWFYTRELEKSFEELHGIIGYTE